MTEPLDVTATRSAYDTLAVDYADLLRSELAVKPLDRAMLAAFAELVQANGTGQVADIGCGPGRVREDAAGLSTGTRAVGMRRTGTRCG